MYFKHSTVTRQADTQAHEPSSDCERPIPLHTIVRGPYLGLESAGGLLKVRPHRIRLALPPRRLGGCLLLHRGNRPGTLSTEP